MLGSLLLLALVRITTASTGNYCLKMTTGDQYHDSGHLTVTIKLEGNDQETKEVNNADIPKNDPAVNKCYEQKIEYVKIQGEDDDAWVGTVHYGTAGSASEQNMVCENCDGGEVTVSGRLAIDKGQDVKDDNVADSYCINSVVCKLKPPTTNAQTTATTAAKTTDAPTTATTAAKTTDTTKPTTTVNTRAVVSSAISFHGFVVPLSTWVASIAV